MSPIPLVVCGHIPAEQLPQNGTANYFQTPICTTSTGQLWLNMDTGSITKIFVPEPGPRYKVSSRDQKPVVAPLLETVIKNLQNGFFISVGSRIATVAGFPKMGCLWKQH